MTTPSIPTGEPETLVRGDSARWYVSDSEYLPTDGWTMVYYFVSEAGPRVQLTGVTDNGDGNWLVTVATTDTQKFVIGRWNWQRVATKASERVTRDSGDMVVTEGFSTILGVSPFVDGRSVARRMLDEVEAALLARASSGQLSMSFNGRSVTWTSLAELYQLRSDLRAEVEAEEAAEGAGLGRQIRIRYGAA